MLTHALASLLLCLALSSLCGCTIGPGRMHDDVLDYNAALRESFQKQILLNLVRSRYGESPEFLVVEGISTQYTLGSEASVSGSLIESTGNALGMSGGVQFNERPTVSYSPTQQCSKFNAQLRRPFLAELLHYLLDDGYPRSHTLHLVVRQINELRNADTICGPKPIGIESFETYREFVDLASLLFENRELELHHATEWEQRSPAIQKTSLEAADLVDAQANGLEFHSLDGESFILEEEVATLRLRVRAEAIQSPEVNTLEALLGITPNQQSYKVVMCDDGHFGRRFEEDEQDEIQITTRSFLGLLTYLAPAVQVPQAHTQACLVDSMVPSCCGGDVPFKVLVSETCPPESTLAIPYRGYWFYIDDRDHSSRTVFRMLTELALIQLSCENLPDTGPILTLPIGG